MENSNTPPARAYRALAIYALLALVYLLINYGLAYNRPFPLVPDDFAVLALGVDDMSWHWKRPVSANLIMLMAPLGMTAAYALLGAMAVLVAWLVATLLGEVFATRLDAWPTSAFAVLAFSHVSAFEHGKYLGLFTNLISHSLGLLALLLLWRGWRSGRMGPCWAALVAYGFCVLAKEDFVLPPWLLLGLLVLLDHGTPGGGALPVARRWMLAVGFFAIGAGSLAWAAYDGNPFVSGLFAPVAANPAYAVDLSPLVLLQSVRSLLWTFAPAYSALAVLAVIALWMTVPAWRLRLAWLLATVAVLVLPYALIPNNMPSFRVYAWLPWLAWIIVLGVMHARPRLAWPRVRAAAVCGLALAVAWSNQAPRTATATQYRQGEDRNRNMLALLDMHRDVLAGHAEVGLVGLDGTSPWCGNGPLYLQRRLGYPQHWIAFVPAASPCYANPRARRPGARKPRAPVDIRLRLADPSSLCASGALPVLDIAADGHGTLRKGADWCAAPTAPRPAPAAT